MAMKNLKIVVGLVLFAGLAVGSYHLDWSTKSFSPKSSLAPFPFGNCVF
jgi:hypothetical protein